MIKARVFFIVLVLAFSIAGTAAGEDYGAERYMQGVISSFDASSVVLNESQRVNMSEATMYYDSAGRASGIQMIVERRWMYVEGRLETDGSITAEKIYSLPGYVSKKNRAKYAFMQLP